MLILADGQDIRHLVPNDPSIRLEVLLNPPATIGEKRNLGCSLIDTDLIAHWDDDDWYGPERLADQIARLLQAGKSVTGYRTAEFRQPSTGKRWIYQSGDASFGIGASLLFRRDWWQAHPFPPLQIAEDNAFVNEARDVGQIVVADAHQHFAVTIHPGNTSPKDTIGNASYRALQ